MEEASRPSLPWEEKVAIGCLILLGLQEIHEGFLYCMEKEAPGASSLQSAWAVLLPLFLGLAAGLHQRNRTAWWLTVALLGSVALIHLGDACDPVRRLLRPEAFARQPGVIYCGLASRHAVDPFGVFWLIAKNALLAAAPLLLLLGRLRKALTPAPTP